MLVGYAGKYIQMKLIEKNNFRIAKILIEAIILNLFLISLIATCKLQQNFYFLLRLIP